MSTQRRQKAAAATSSAEKQRAAAAAAERGKGVVGVPRHAEAWPGRGAGAGEQQRGHTRELELGHGGHELGDDGYGDEIKRGRGGFGRGDHNGSNGSDGKAGGGLETRQSSTAAGDVRGE